MKLITALAIAAASGGVCAAPAFAQSNAPAVPEAPAKPSSSGFYAGVGINLYFLDRDAAGDGMGVTFQDQPSPGAFMGRLGYAFNDNIAVEVEAGIGGAKSEFTTSGGGTDGKLGVNTPLGAHLVLSMPLQGDIYIIGKVGYVSAKVSREYLGTDYPDLDISSASYGIGGGIRSGSWDYRMEYCFTSGGDSGDGGVLGIFALYHF